MVDSVNNVAAGRLAGVLTASIVTIYLFGAYDSFVANLVIAAIVAYVCPPIPLREWSAIDYAVMGFIAFDAISGLYGASQVLLFNNLAMCAVAGCIYLSLRRMCDNRKAVGAFLGIVGAAMTVALLLALFTFYELKHSSLEVGFATAYYARYLYRPVGYLVNVWGEVVLVAMWWFCLMRRKWAFVSLLLAAVAIMFTFSKGAYLSLGVFLMGCLLLADKRIKQQMLIVCMAAAVITVVFCYTELGDMLSLGGQSQQMSAQWRVETTASVGNVVMESPVWGHGNGSYTLATDRVLAQDSSKNYTSFAPNLWTQLLVEKGTVGLALLLAVIVAVAVGVWRRRHDTTARITGILLLAMLVKECTQSVIMATPVLQLLVVTLMALLQRKCENEVQPSSVVIVNKRQRIAPVAVLLCVAVVVVGHDRAFNIRQEAMCEGRYDDIAVSDRPSIIQKGVLLTKRYAETHEPAAASAAEKLLAKAGTNNDNSDIYPQYLLAWLSVQQGNIDAGRAALADLAEKYSRNSLFLYSLGDADYRQGKIEEARASWVEAVYYMPRVLHMENVATMAATDSIFRQQLVSLKDRLCSPQDKARYGYILCHIGNESQARIYLKDAVGELPNLATPWLLLGDEEKYRFLSRGSGKSLIHKGEDAIVIDEWNLFDASYRVRFKKWYGFDLYGN